VGLDPRNATDRLVNLSQGGLLLERDNYLGTDPRSVEIRSEYERYLVRIFTLTGRADPVGSAAAVLNLEIELARAQIAQPVLQPAPLSVSQMNGAFPGFDWPAWAKPQGIDRVAGVVVAQPEFFRSFAALVPQRPMATWRAWLAARYITALSPYLNKDISDARFDFFGAFLTGQRIVIPRWKRGVSLVNTILGDAVGRVYVDRHFPRSSRERVERIVSQVVRAFKQSVLESSWMSPSARTEAHAKLMALSTRVGFPDVWKDYRGLEIRADDLVGNLTRAAAFDNARRMNRLARPEERGEWLATPQLVNAYYAPAQNEIVLPAAILQPPYFNAEADDAVNYGAIGAVIGHEIGHGLDHCRPLVYGHRRVARLVAGAGCCRLRRARAAGAGSIEPRRRAPQQPSGRRLSSQRHAGARRKRGRRGGPGGGASCVPHVARRPARTGHRRADGRPAILPGLGAHLAGKRSAGVPPAVFAHEPLRAAGLPRQRDGGPSGRVFTRLLACLLQMRCSCRRRAGPACIDGLS
jgi:hypothetical protein